MKIELEIWQMGDLVAKGTFTCLDAARRAYARLINNDACGVEVYVDGRRLKALEAWDLLQGWNRYCAFYYGQTERRGPDWEEEERSPARK
ncbi:MAG: hypothetical protein IJD13_00800 [Oscillospiraceae bacterium]|nr:hypothetical protein [Oscillospiraceae bacterium]